jgi:hypothetical protein
MKSLIYLAYIAGVITIAVQCIGCTGMEVGGKLWVTRVDEKQESQRTTNVPLKCYLWSDCSQQSTVQGS